MIRQSIHGFAASAAAALTLAVAVAVAAPANAFAITAGFTITSGDRWCTVGFPDPQTPNIVYTAGHCYRDGIAEVNLGSMHIGRYMPQIYDPTTDLIAIKLYSNIPSEFSLMSREPLLTSTPPTEGSTVCKYGATTQETCGKVLSVNATTFSVQMEAEHGDSGAPIYENTPSGKGVHVVGMLISQDTSRRGVIYCSTIGAINTFLKRTWGSSWDI